MRRVELAGGPKDGEKISVPDNQRDVSLPIRISTRDGKVRYEGALYVERKGDEKVFDFHPVG
jgi:hypothetical protein